MLSKCAYRFRSIAAAVMFSAIVLALAASGQDAAPPSDQGGSFKISGNPESGRGAPWEFRGTVDGVSYDLSGVLMKPRGPGPFPAVIVSHGAEGSAENLMQIVGPTMVRWGLVCIAPNYTHSIGVPIGSPVGSDGRGASQANILRLHMTLGLLGRLGYVDMRRVGLHGHSMGAYVEEAAASVYPSDFRVASTTGGGMRPDRFSAGPAPGLQQVRSIRVPFQLHHGEGDETVPFAYDQHLAQALTDLGVPNELYSYPGGHLAPRSDPAMFERVHAWYTHFGMFDHD